MALYTLVVPYQPRLTDSILAILIRGSPSFLVSTYTHLPVLGEVGPLEHLPLP